MMLASAKKADGVIVPGLRVFTATGVFPCHIPETNRNEKHGYYITLILIITDHKQN